MIFAVPDANEPVDQGDIIDGCPVLAITDFDVSAPSIPRVASETCRAIVLTQTCDLANRKTDRVVIAVVLDAAQLVASGKLKAADVRGPIRAGRVYGWYFLPRSPSLVLAESIVDFHQIHSLPLHVVESLCHAGRRRARLQPLYREHLARHFADTYSRIGLPMPYETD